MNQTVHEHQTKGRNFFRNAANSTCLGRETLNARIIQSSASKDR